MTSTPPETSFLVTDVEDNDYRDGLPEFLPPRDVARGEVTFLVERATPSPAQPKRFSQRYPPARNCTTAQDRQTMAARRWIPCDNGQGVVSRAGRIRHDACRKRFVI